MATQVYSTAKTPLTALLERADINHPTQTIATLQDLCGKKLFSSRQNKIPFPLEAMSESWKSLFSVISTEGRNLRFRVLTELGFLGCRLEMTLRHSPSRERELGGERAGQCGLIVKRVGCEKAVERSTESSWKVKT